MSSNPGYDKARAHAEALLDASLLSKRLDEDTADVLRAEFTTLPPPRERAAERIAGAEWTVARCRSAGKGELASDLVQQRRNAWAVMEALQA